MKKSAQTAGMAGRTVQDLYLAIMMDTGLSYGERQQLLQELNNMIGSSPPSTPLQSILWKLSGAGIGYLIAKYFNMGPVGQGVLAATGLGLGTLVQNRMGQQRVSYLYNSLNK